MRCYPKEGLSFSLSLSCIHTHTHTHTHAHTYTHTHTHAHREREACFQSSSLGAAKCESTEAVYFFPPNQVHIRSTETGFLQSISHSEDSPQTNDHNSLTVLARTVILTPFCSEEMRESPSVDNLSLKYEFLEMYDIDDLLA